MTAVRTFEELERFAGTAREYRALRAAHPTAPATRIWQYLADPDGRTFGQFQCRHDWVINEESDRCYCLCCGLDGDA